MTIQRTALLGTKSSKQDFKDFRGMFGITVMSWKPVEITCTRLTNVFLCTLTECSSLYRRNGKAYRRTVQLILGYHLANHSVADCSSRWLHSCNTLHSCLSI